VGAEPPFPSHFIIIIIKNEKIRVTLCENAAGALYIVNKMCVDVVVRLNPKVDFLSVGYSWKLMD